MGRVVHRWQPGPVVRPAVHVLLVACLKKLNVPKFTSIGHLFYEQELAGVNDRLGHHVLQAGLFREVDNLLAVFNGRGHWHRTHHMLAGLKGRQRHRCVVGDRGVNVNRVDLLVRKEIGIAGVPPLNSIGIADLIELVL